MEHHEQILLPDPQPPCKATVTVNKKSALMTNITLACEPCFKRRTIAGPIVLVQFELRAALNGCLLIQHLKNLKS